ncbi:DUF4926 domain-containing protein [Micromonospora sp. PLK6-60]|uniref:DUF4926 domain-containing protein n=1 Tax=Micromonospora sp. PLK6-60 TaxID=2873383 RepID=UPI001CA6A383|nr:DUF4926 domain-containing protein [Micromonospora sp. PLK6-60]MBY8870476.1 DUF4926 domain-containing protein [Micromonospora sp. PLK6-60]
MDLYDVVELTEDLPDEELQVGAVGTIVHVFQRPRLAYEVEFTDDGGRTVASVALTPEKIRLAARH